MTNRLIYKIFDHTEGNFARQQTTSVDISNIPKIWLWSNVEEVIRERFKDYDLDFNHAGLTVGIYYKGDL